MCYELNRQEEGHLTVVKTRKVHAEGLIVKQVIHEPPKKMDIRSITERCTSVDTKGARPL